jgi:hypothetical protein
MRGSNRKITEGGTVEIALGAKALATNLPPLPGETVRAAENRLSSGRAQAHQNFRLNQTQFRLQPRPASSDFGAVGLLMQPAFSAFLKLENV